MKSFMTAILTLGFATLAQAHVEPGLYKGVTADGAACEMKSIRMYFENDVAHPLNERVEIELNGQTYKVGHPPVIDAKTSTAFFNHGLFQGVLPTNVGANALVVTMVHTQEFEGPSDFTLITNNWRTGAKTNLKCLNIKLVE